MSSRRRDVPAEGSWRLVDGENDSFDTSIMPAFSDDGLVMPLPGGQPCPGSPTQQSFSLSQGQGQDQMSFNSQDSIRDFANHPDDDRVILREPFRPTVPPSIASTSSSSARPSLYQTAETQLRMPRLDIDSDMASSGDSLGTARGWGRNRRSSDGSRRSRGGRRNRQCEGDDSQAENWDEKARPPRFIKNRLPTPAPWSLYDLIQWMLHVARFIFRYMTAPIAIGLAVHYVYSNGISYRDVSAKLNSVSLAPLCNSPAVSHLDLPFCEPYKPDYPGITNSAIVCSVNFGDLMGVQSKFKDVLDKSLYGVSMPLELKRSEMATRSLRRLLKDSDIASKEDLIPELNGYINKVGRAGSDIQTFYTHIGSTVDSVININRWTLRHMNSLSVEPETPGLAAIVAWLFNPFRPSQQNLNDQALLDKYVEHIILVQDRLEKLIDEGTALALLLYHSQSHLTIIYEHAMRSSSGITLKPDSLLSTIWAYIGGMLDEQRDLDEQISLLKKVDLQFAGAIAHLLSLIEELKDIQAGLGDLLRRNKEPPVVWDDVPPSQTTLGEQMDLVKSGLQWLELARKSAAESEAVRFATDAAADAGGE